MGQAVPPILPHVVEDQEDSDLRQHGQVAQGAGRGETAGDPGAAGHRQRHGDQHHRSGAQDFDHAVAAFLLGLVEQPGEQGFQQHKEQEDAENGNILGFHRVLPGVGGPSLSQG